MRIAIVTTSWPADEDDPSGHFVRTEARELERAGNEVSVIAPESGRAFGWPGVWARLREKPTRVADAARWIASARARIRRLEADRVVAHWAVPCAWPIAMANRGPELHVVSHGGDVRLLAAMPRAARRRIALAVACRARIWRFVAPGLRDDLLGVLERDARDAVEAIADVREASIELPDVRDAAQERRQTIGSGPIAVSVGRLVPSKRVDRAIEHVARTREARVLVIVGDGPERGHLERLARESGVDARFVGRVARVEALAWIGAADFVIHASEAEGRSTVLREAQALGTRVRFIQ
ncbi:MAG TPA: glycosyltransferase [Polyangiaceae bacterium]|nr:glycosyltransferase [Polyangiaceae bacterium]